MRESENQEQPTRWMEVSPEFGSAMPNGSCNAYVEASGGVCGYPRRADGTCINGHPAPPVDATEAQP